MSCPTRFKINIGGGNTGCRAGPATTATSFSPELIGTKNNRTLVSLDLQILGSRIDDSFALIRGRCPVQRLKHTTPPFGANLVIELVMRNLHYIDINGVRAD